MRGRPPDGLVRRATGLEGPVDGVEGRDGAGAGPGGRVGRRARRSTSTTGAAAATGNRDVRHRDLTADVTAAVTGNTGSVAGWPAATGSGGTGGGGSGCPGRRIPTPPNRSPPTRPTSTRAEADLTNAEQSLTEATLPARSAAPSSRWASTWATPSVPTRAPRSSRSSAHKSYEVEATLDSSQVPSVKVGQSASVEVDGVDGTIDGTVSQVGPVQSGDVGYTYPVVVALPSSASGCSPGRRPTWTSRPARSPTSSPCRPRPCRH